MLKVIANDLHHFHTHLKIQCSHAPQMGPLSLWIRPWGQDRNVSPSDFGDQLQ